MAEFGSVTPNPTPMSRKMARLTSIRRVGVICAKALILYVFAPTLQPRWHLRIRDADQFLLLRLLESECLVRSARDDAVAERVVGEHWSGNTMMLDFEVIL